MKRSATKSANRPYSDLFLLIVGGREAAEGKVTLRHRDGTDLGTLPVDEAITLLAEHSRAPDRCPAPRTSQPPGAPARANTRSGDDRMTTPDDLSVRITRRHADLLVLNGQVVTPAGIERLDIACLGGRIVALGELRASWTADNTLEAVGLHVLPGVIDTQVHFR